LNLKFGKAYQLTKGELLSNLKRRSLQNRMGARNDPMGQVRTTEHAEPRLQGPEEPRNSRNLLPMRGNDRWGHLNGLRWQSWISKPRR